MATRDDEATVALEGNLDESKGLKTERLDPDAMIPFGPRPVPADRWFESKPLWQRAIILLAGVTMNVVLAVVVAIGIFAVYGRPYLRAGGRERRGRETRCERGHAARRFHRGR